MITQAEGAKLLRKKKRGPDLEGIFLRKWSDFCPTQMPKQQYRFSEARRFRFDFCWPHKKVAVEISGGTWIRGRHSRGSGQQRDFDKLNLAAEWGWSVLQYTTNDVQENSAAMLEQIYKVLIGAPA